MLIPDCKGDPDALDVVFAARPDVLNHNLETVARLQRAVRPSAGYARSLAGARPGQGGRASPPSPALIVGHGRDRRGGRGHARRPRRRRVDIVTIGQYLRPTSHHLPVARWWTPDEFAALKTAGEAMGIAHVEASPLTRSSYHARAAAASLAPASRLERAAPA